MRDILSKFNIEAGSVIRAVQSVNDLSDSDVRAFLNAVGIEASNEEAIAVAKYAAHAVVNGADSPEKVKTFVQTRMGEFRAKVEAKTVPKPVALAPVAEAAGFTAEVVPDSAPDNTPKARGRRKSAETAFHRAVKLIEENSGTGREGIINAMIAAGINKNSALVYLWKYNKGERP